MNNPLQDDLLGYVLGALDAQEQRDLQQRIDQDPELEEQLLKIKSALLPLDYIEPPESRPGLARRTCESVALWQNSDCLGHPKTESDVVDSVAQAAPLPLPSPSLESGSDSMTPGTDSRGAGNEANWSAGAERILHPSTWSMPDVLVGVALLAIVAGILFPAISITRSNSRITACKEKLQRIGIALQEFSAINDGKFIEVPRTGPLGVNGSFAILLKDAQLLEQDSNLECPGLGATRPAVFIPSSSQVLAAETEEELYNYHRTMSGDFGYTLGHYHNGKYRPPRKEGRTHTVVVADQPSVDLEGRKSKNHDGRGQNCLYGDGRVEFVCGHMVQGDDALFVNDYGVVAPGANFRDNVIAPSHLSLEMSLEIGSRTSLPLE